MLRLIADNVAVTEGSGKTVATDDVGGAQYQRVKLDLGGDGLASPFTGTITGITNTVAVYFDRGDPGVKITSGSVTVSGSITGITNSIAVHVLSTNGTMAVNVGKVDGTVAVRLDPGYEIGSIKGINSSIQVHILSTNGTMAVNVGKTDGTVTVRFDPGYTLGHIQSIKSTVGVYIDSTQGTIRTKLDPETVISGIQSSINVRILQTAGTIIVKNDPSSAGLATDDAAFGVAVATGSPVMGLFDDTATDSVDEGDAGVLRMTGNRILMVHADNTASIFTVAGSTSGVSPSGVTLVSPSANASFKVFAFSLQTTGIVSLVARFTNGGGTATEFWRGLVTSNQTASAPIGANLAVQPPGYLFATGVSTTLALHLDTASLVHYSVSYFKESA